MRPLFRWPVSLVPPNKLATSQSARLGIVLGLISLWYRSQLLAFAFRRRQLRCQHRVRTPGRKPDPEKRHHLHPLTVSHTSLLSSSPNSLRSCRMSHPVFLQTEKPRIRPGQQPTINSCEGTATVNHANNTLEWHIPEIDPSNSSGLTEFTVQSGGDTEVFFPIAVDFVSNKGLCGVEVSFFSCCDQEKEGACVRS